MPQQHLVAVVGAGPAGIYGTRKLAEAGHRVVLLNRDIKPGGLAEYGIYVEKEKMKT
jgi:ferredoxin--NADP+ reductase